MQPYAHAQAFPNSKIAAVLFEVDLEGAHVKRIHARSPSRSLLGEFSATLWLIAHYSLWKIPFLEVCHYPSAPPSSVCNGITLEFLESYLVSHIRAVPVYTNESKVASGVGWPVDSCAFKVRWSCCGLSGVHSQINDKDSCVIVSIAECVV